MRKVIVMFVALISAVTCSGVGPFERMPSGDISIDPGEVRFGAIGARRQLSLVDGGGSTIPTGNGVVWRSSDPGVAAVDGSGTVTAEGDGQAVVTASFGDDDATALVEVAATLETVVEVLAVDQSDGDPSNDRVVTTITVVAP